ncbi:MAG: response regulator [Magnetococcales bacterium]|nr:response regulator [Magnetococcales bacterium]
MMALSIYTLTAQSLRTEIEQNLLKRSSERMLAIDRTLFERIADIKTLATDALWCTDNVPWQQLNKRLITARNVYKAYAHISLFSREGIRIASSSGIGMGQLINSLPISSHFDHSTQDKTVVFHGFSTLIDMPVIYIAHRIDCSGQSQSDGHRGLMLAAISLEQMGDILVSEPYGTNSVKIDLMDEGGLLLYSNHNKKAILTAVISDPDPELLSQPNHKEESRDSIIFHIREPGYLDFGGNGWSLRVSVAMEDVFAPASALRNKILLLSIIGVGIAILAALLLARYFMRPIHTLVHHIQLISSGSMSQRQQIAGDNLDRHMSATSQDEFNILARAIYRMVLDLDHALTAAELATQAKSSFLANMSHEIRTPMNAIIGLTDLAMQMEMPAKLRDYLNKIDHSAQSLLRLINDILDFSKIEAGRLEIEQVDFLLRDIFSRLAMLFSAKVAEKHIELVLCLSEECRYELNGDPIRLEQILLNLISNAIKFTDEGEVEVQVKTIHESIDRVILQFSVRDTGIGMTEQQLAKLFRPFSQADSSTTRRYGGTGLGLSISQKLVDMMGGQIWAVSTANVGSNFFFTMPFQRHIEAEEQDIALPEELEWLRVLVVDDNQSVRKALCTILRLFHLNFEAVSSGLEAATALSDAISHGHPFQLVLIDGDPGGMNGLEALFSSIRQATSDQRPKTVLMTSAGQKTRSRNDANGTHVDGYLDKPIDCSQLFDTIMTVFGQEVVKPFRPGRDVIDPQQIITRIGGARLLLVEDNAINQQVAREVLEGVRLIVDCAENGEQALMMLALGSYDAVLMDIQMPVMDGYTATQRIRSQSQWAELPIIAMTANAMKGDRDKCLVAGMNDHVGKPIVKKDLFAALIKWIKPGERVLPPAREPVLSLVEDGSKDNLPETLSGMNVTAALQRMNGNRPLLRSILVEFHRDFSHTVTTLRTLLASAHGDDLKSAASMVHKIKGISGNLSATVLFEVAARLEREIIDEQHHAWTESIAELDRLLTPLLTDISTWSQRETSGTENHHPARPDQETLTAALMELNGLIRNCDIETVARLATLKAAITGVAETKTVITRMDEAIDCFDFESAQTDLLELAHILDISLD